jgi:hypothetical protein
MYIKIKQKNGDGGRKRARVVFVKITLTLLLPYIESGAEDQNRTGDAGLFRPSLYQLSYLGTRLH